MSDKFDEFRQRINLDQHIDTILDTLAYDTSGELRELAIQFRTLSLPIEASFFQVALRRLTDTVYLEVNRILERPIGSELIEKSFVFDYLQTLYEKNPKVANRSEVHIGLETSLPPEYFGTNGLHLNCIDDDLEFIWLER